MCENLQPIKIYRRIKNIYGESTISVQRVRKWRRKFESACENIVDESRSGWQISVADKMLENKIDTIVQCDQKVISDIAYQVNAGQSTVQNIVTKNPKYQKICVYWIPHMLTVKQCAAHIVTCNKNLTHFQKEENTLLNHLVISNELWCHYHIPTCK